MNNNDAINYPWFVIIAGPNGAGKSTFHEKVIQEWDGFRDVQFVNMDLYKTVLIKQDVHHEYLDVKCII